VECQSCMHHCFERLLDAAGVHPTKSIKCHTGLPPQKFLREFITRNNTAHSRNRSHHGGRQATLWRKPDQIVSKSMGVLFTTRWRSGKFWTRFPQGQEQGKASEYLGSIFCVMDPFSVLTWYYRVALLFGLLRSSRAQNIPRDLHCSIMELNPRVGSLAESVVSLQHERSSVGWHGTLLGNN